MSKDQNTGIYYTADDKPITDRIHQEKSFFFPLKSQAIELSKQLRSYFYEGYVLLKNGDRRYGFVVPK